jgi:hypothetical protein
MLLPPQGLRGDAALRLLTEPEHARLRAVGARDAEGRCAEDPGEQGLRGCRPAEGGCATRLMGAPSRSQYPANRRHLQPPTHSIYPTNVQLSGFPLSLQ